MNSYAIIITKIINFINPFEDRRLKKNPINYRHAPKSYTLSGAFFMERKVKYTLDFKLHCVLKVFGYPNEIRTIS